MRLPLVALFSLLPAILATPIRNTLAPLSASGEVIEDSYIVVFKKGVTPEQIALHLNSVTSLSAQSVSTKNQAPPTSPISLATHPLSACSGR